MPPMDPRLAKAIAEGEFDRKRVKIALAIIAAIVIAVAVFAYIEIPKFNAREVNANHLGTGSAIHLDVSDRQPKQEADTEALQFIDHRHDQEGRIAITFQHGEKRYEILIKERPLPGQQ